MHNYFELFINSFNRVWHRRWYAIAVAWVICLIGWGTVAVMPDQYRASTQLLVDTSNVLQPILQGIAIQSDVENEVQLMRSTLLSRGNIEKVMRMTDLDLEVYNAIEKDRLINLLKKSMTIGSSSAGSGNSLLTISFVRFWLRLLKKSGP